MLFNSAEFLIFFPIAAGIYWLIPHRVKYLWLLACSYYFYMCWNPKYIILILYMTLVTYIGGLIVGKENECVEHDQEYVRFRKKVVVIVCILLNLIILISFKYLGFVFRNIQAVLDFLRIKVSIPQCDVLLPVGISFYTFQTLGYIIDVYKGKIQSEKNFARYALFVSFFPQLVAGPIERAGDLLSQLYEHHTFQFEKVKKGFMLMLWGFFLKLVIADRIAVFVDAIYDAFFNGKNAGGYYLIVASVLFAVQIYCDFAGYSTIAIGAAMMMGFRLTDNFFCPYMARSVAEFWHRWHITLSGWFRDYVYIPLGGNRRGVMRTAYNLMITFLLSGLWHGASWTYVIWGGLNGLYQIVGKFLKPYRERVIKWSGINKRSFSHKVLQVGTTFVLIDFSWIFFRAESINAAFAVIKSILSADNFYVLVDDSLFDFGLDWKNFMVLIFAILVLLVADYCKYKNFCIRDAVCRQDLWFQWIFVMIGIFSILIFGMWGAQYDANAFIYFQF